MASSHHYHLPLTTTTTIESLPNHILSEVLAIIGSSSIDDLFTLKFCCKNFRNLIEQDNYIYQQISMQKLPYVPSWFITPQESSFLARCRECKNPESLFREGMIKFFTPLTMNLDRDSSSCGLERLKDSSSCVLEILKEASKYGHKEAIYMCGMILLCSEDEEDRKQGFEYLGIMAKLGFMKACRKNVEVCLKMLWKNEHVRRLFMNLQNHRLCGLDMCLGLQEIARLEGGWPIAVDEDEASLISCQLCRCDYELRQFSKIFRPSRLSA